MADYALDPGFDDFVRSRSASLLRLCHVLTGDRGLAEDLLQIALANCFRHWGRAVSQGREEAYVRTAIVNAHISATRRRRLQEVLTLHLPERGGPDPSEAVDSRDLLRRALARLPSRMRAAVVLRHYAGLSEQEAAEVLRCSVGNIKGLTSRGLEQLRKTLQGSGPPPHEPARAHRPEALALSEETR